MDGFVHSTQCFKVSTGIDKQFVPLHCSNIAQLTYSHADRYLNCSQAREQPCIWQRLYTVFGTLVCGSRIPSLFLLLTPHSAATEQLVLNSASVSSNQQDCKRASERLPSGKTTGKLAKAGPVSTRFLLVLQCPQNVLVHLLSRECGSVWGLI